MFFDFITLALKLVIQLPPKKKDRFVAHSQRFLVNLKWSAFAPACAHSYGYFDIHKGSALLLVALVLPTYEMADSLE
jgi:hypothetical protein